MHIALPCSGVGQGVQRIPHDSTVIEVTHAPPQRCSDGGQGCTQARS